ncbi:MAG: DUF1049 domain-containing protein [Gammaproteobacteria bacterium]|jgi:uncharacterized integral membrane protein|nr:DUF1049 domain-containing protein [Gammaproteobacteria bacterium]MBT5053696.1 DUF1049 domain-containing protein [Gammaproteobacteria bacterium]
MNWIKGLLFRLILLVLFIALFLLATENSLDVSLQFLSQRSPELPLSWWLAGTLVVGIVLGRLWALIGRWFGRDRS